MTTREFSEGFDTLLNSYAHGQPFGDSSEINDIHLDEFEKSQYLTKAQEELVKSLYDGTVSTFERDEATRRYLQELVKQRDYTEEQADEQRLQDKFIHSVFKLPDLWYIVYEQAKQYADSECLSSLVAEVLPVQHDDYIRISRNPFRGPTTKRVLRLDKGNNEVELVSINKISNYTIRYLVQPTPIVLTDLDDNTINGINVETNCTLPSSLHTTILNMAVKAVLEAKGLNNKDNK